MFEGLAKTIYRTIVDCHDVGQYNLTKAEVHSQLLTANPALTQGTRDEIADMFSDMSDPSDKANLELQQKIVHEFWMRDQARIIGEKAIDIYTGTDLDFTDIKEAIQRVTEHTTSSSETYTIYEADFMELIEIEERGCDFPFELDLIKENVQGTSRGNLGIIFARPEVGKTTFCASLAASYIRQGKTVAYWANEEPVSKIKIRIIQSYLRATKDEMISGRYHSLRCIIKRSSRTLRLSNQSVPLLKRSSGSAVCAAPTLYSLISLISFVSAVNSIVVMSA